MTPERMAAVRWWLLVAAVAVVVALGISYVQRFGGELDRARADRDALRTQVLQMGGTPVAGEPGKDGAVGPSGPAGRDGRDGTPGNTGRQGQPGSPGPSGQPGKDGKSGTPGPTGAAGVPGTQGATGPAGPSGPSGPAGERGEKGDTGEPGEAVMCGAGYHPEEIIIVPYKGTWQVCRKDGSEDQ